MLRIKKFKFLFFLGTKKKKFNTKGGWRQAEGERQQGQQRYCPAFGSVVLSLDKLKNHAKVGTAGKALEAKGGMGWKSEGKKASFKKSAISAIFKTTNSSLLLSDFVDIQRKSFCELLEKGLIEEFSKRNPITNKNLEIFFYPEYYQLTPPEYNPRRAILYSKSYSAKLFVPVQLTDKKLQKSQLKWVLIGNLPLMTKRGHFILNGAPRVIVNQILRSPGIYFQGSLKQIFSEKWSEKPEITYKRFYTDLICLRGTWLRIEIDKNKDIWAQMKKIPKIPILWFLLAMGLTERIIFKSVINPMRLLANFNLEIKRKIHYEYVTNASDAWKEISNLISSKQNLVNSSFPQPAPSPPLNPVLAANKQEDVGTATHTPKVCYAGKEVSNLSLTKGKLSTKTKKKIILNTKKNDFAPFLLPFSSPPLPVKHSLNPSAPFPSFLSLLRTGSNINILAAVNLKEARIGWKNTARSEKKGIDHRKEGKQSVAPIKELQLSQTGLKSEKSSYSVGQFNKHSLGSETNIKKTSFVSFFSFSEQSKEGRNWIFKRFMNPRTYDLGKQGRLNFNRKLGLSISSNQTTLTAQDVLYATDYLLKLEKGLKKIDDIDHLKNRRVRTSGELLQIQIGIGLIRLEKIIRNNLALKINAQTIKSVGTSLRVLPKETSSFSNKVKPLIKTKSHATKNHLNNKKLNLEKNSSISAFSVKKGGVGGAITGFAPEELRITNLINTKAFNGALREFFGSCLTPDHRVLTDKGFIPIQEVTLNHKVATLKNNEELVYEYPTKVHKYDHDGLVYEVNVPGVSLKTTQNHRMFVQLKTDIRIKVRPFALIPASDLLNKKVRYKKNALWTAPDYQFILPGIPAHSPKEYSEWLKGLCNSTKTTTFHIHQGWKHALSEKIMPMDAWLIFMGFFISEVGNLNHGAEGPDTKVMYKIVLSQKKPNQCAIIEKILPELNMVYYKEPSGSRCFNYNIYDKQLWAYLRAYSSGASKKALPEWVWNLSRRQCNILLAALISDDENVCKISEAYLKGHLSVGRSPFINIKGQSPFSCYYSNSDQLINDVSRLILHAGYVAFIRKNHAMHYPTDNKLIRATTPDWSVNVLSSFFSPFVNTLRSFPPMLRTHPPKVELADVDGWERGQPVDDQLVYYKGPVYCLTVPNEVFYVERQGKAVWTGNSQLSQFMDQLNPLAEITHKRRLSSMGPGGVTRDSATLAIRGIHPTHYGRICPIETPEGKNTGLVNSLTTYARANSQGFLESPFYKVYKGQIQKTAGIYFLSAEQEENIKVAAADVSSLVGRIGFLPKSKIPAKIGYGDTISKITRNRVEYIGVSPIQMISIATSLIPFLEHDDANRALMGSNMQRQAVPLIRAERPLVGTGLESRTVSDSGHAVIAKESGYVAYVSAKKIVIYTIP
uniref:DNA-directed RNA polymerase n=1 Tax=Chlamydomonas nivalis TaxID=47906 RepID=A0A0S2IBY4_9CHLO|nr:beta subunit of RNA polymerase [Chlamydomonas nivalis]